MVTFPDIYSLIFQILQVQPTGNFQTDFLNLLFFPHVVIIIWLYLVARGPIIKTFHPGLGVLLALAIYIFIVFNGWYSIISSFAIFWLTLTIIFSFFYFIIPKIIHPATTESRLGWGRKLIGGAFLRKDINKALDELKQELVYARRKLNEARDAHNQREELYFSTRVDELEREIRRLERQKGF